MPHPVSPTDACPADDGAASGIGGPAPGAAAPRPDQEEAGGHPRRKLTLYVVLLGQFVVIGSTAALNVALSGITHELHASPTEIQWIALAYQIGYSALLVIGGRLGDLFGHRRLYLLGLAGVWLGAVLAASAQSPLMLILARLGMGLAGGLSSPQTLAFVQTLFPRSERPMAFGMFGVTGGIAYIACQILSGLLIGLNLFDLGWRNAMTVTIVLGGVALLAARRLLPAARPDRSAPLDLLGGAASAALAVSLLYPVIQSSSSGWSPLSLALLCACPLIAFGFFRHERRLTASDAHPLVDLRLFKVENFSAGLGAAIAISCTSFAPFYLITLTLQFGHGFAPLATAMATTPAPFGSVVGSRVSGHLAHRSPSFSFTLGSALLALGVGLAIGAFYLAGARLSALHLIIPMAIIGFSTGILGPTATRLTLSHVPTARAGSASSILQTGQQYMTALGMAGGGAMFFALVSGPGPAGHFAALTVTLIANLLLAGLIGLGAARLGRSGS